jgi:dTDP-4-dehydrorhamnose reductase
VTWRGRAAVFGADGQIGRELVRVLGTNGYDVRPFTKARCDVTDAAAVDQALDGLTIGDVVLNAAAYNDVAGAESDFASALRVNGCGPFFIAAAAARCGAAMVHFSSDYVFDGNKRSPYLESDRAYPLNAYGRTKLCGESLAVQTCPSSYVARVATVFGIAAPGARANFVDRVVSAARAGERLRLMADGAMSPTYAADAAEMVVRLLLAEAPCGAYHVANSGGISWYGLAHEIARQCGMDLRAEALDASATDASVRRPLFSALASEKLERVRLRAAPWQDGLRRYLTAKGLIAEG